MHEFGEHGGEIVLVNRRNLLTEGLHCAFLTDQYSFDISFFHNYFFWGLMRDGSRTRKHTQDGTVLRFIFVSSDLKVMRC